MKALNKRFFTFRNILTVVFSMSIASGFFLLSNVTSAASTPYINYQGKLTNNTGSTVADGTYNMRFWLLTTQSIATTSAVWTESLTSTNKVQVTNGLFSVMLGSTSALTAVDFNQRLYLGVEVGGTGSPSWDGEMSPRKIIGSVPSAFEAKKLGGVASTSFLRSDQVDTATSLLTFSGGLISQSSSTILRLTTLTATTTNLVINGERFTDLTGTGLTIASNALTVNTSYLNTLYASTTAFNTCSELATILSGNTTGSCGTFALSASPTFTGTVNAAAATLSSTLTLSGTAANIALGSNWLSGDGQDEGVFVDGSGNVGVGTTSPSTKLHIQGTTASVDPKLVISGSLLNINTGHSIDFRNVSALSYARIAGVTDSVGGAGELSLWTSSAQNSVAATEKVRITGAGNVGIGTTSPGYPLHIYGNTNGAVRGVTQNDNSGTDATARFSVFSNGGDASFLAASTGYTSVTGAADSLLINANSMSGGIKFSNNGVAQMILSSAGNVGIGTSTPAAKLDIYGLSPNINIESSGVYSFLSFANNGGSTKTAYLVANNSGDLTQRAVTKIFASQDGSTEHMRITSGGLVGIGTTSPSQELTVTGDFRLTGRIYDSANSAGTNGMVLKSTGTGQIWVATSTLGITGGSGLASTDIDTCSELAAIMAGETGTCGSLVLSADPTFTGTVNAAALTLSSTLTLSGTAANIALGSNWLSGDGQDEGVFVGSTGNVGIGTTTPGTKLQVQTVHTTNIDDEIRIGSTYLGNFYGLGLNYRIDAAGNPSTHIVTHSGGARTTTLTLGATGNVGVGTTTPNQKLSIFANGADAAIEFSTISGPNEKWTMGVDDSDGGKFKISSSSVLGTNDRFVIDGSGRVGIGDTTPSYYLDVAGSSGVFHVDSTGLTASSTSQAPHIEADVDEVTLFLGSSGNTSGYTANQSSGNVRFNGSSVQWGDFGYYPTGGDNGELGHFRFSLASTDIDRTPDAKLGVGSLYSASNVGIGTTTPGYLLTVAGTTYIGATTTVKGGILPLTNDLYDLGSTSKRFKDLYLGGETLHIGTSLTDEATIGYTTSSNILSIGTDGTSNGDIAFFTDDLYLDKSTGRVGIGTTTPTQMLSVGLTTGSQLLVTSAGAVTDGSWTADVISSTYLDTGILLATELDTCAEFAALGTIETGTCGSLVLSVDPTFTGTLNAATIAASGAITSATLDTGQGANELYDMNQNVQTTDAPTFSGLTLISAGSTGIENGRIDGVASTPFIDFHSGATAVDYDARLIASSGSGASGGGALSLTAASFAVSGTITEGGSAVQSAADLDTCAEFAALGAIETGTCGSLVMSASPTFTGTANFAAITTSNSGLVTNLNADTLDSLSSGSFLRLDAGSTRSAGQVTAFDNTAGATLNGLSANTNLVVYNATAGTDAFMTFHVGGDFAGYFGIGGAENDLVVGGWSYGNNRHRIWHSGNDGAASTLDADLLDGISSGSFAQLSGATFSGTITTPSLSFTGGSSITTDSVNRINLNATNYTYIPSGVFYVEGSSILRGGITDDGGNVTVSDNLDVTGNVLMPASGYVNFGSTAGSGGYGIRDNGGTMEFKHSGGAWASLSGKVTTYRTIYTDITAEDNADVVFNGAVDSAASYSAGVLTLPSNTDYYVVEVIGGGGGSGRNGGGGGGGGGYARETYTNTTTMYYTVGAGGGENVAGGSSCFGTNTTACTSPSASATGGGLGADGSSGAGGTGGAGSGGDFNYSGGDAADGFNTANGGGGGGSGHYGGSGGDGVYGNTTNNVAVAIGAGNGGKGGYSGGTLGTAGSAPGGGGGGSASPSVGLAGGDGGFFIHVYTESTAGADLAELYPVSDYSMQPGHIVAFESGLPITITKASKENGSTILAGVISTQPGLLLGVGDEVAQRAVALAGRVPTKVNFEGGPIQIGDRIALSSIPGVGKKATVFEDSVGIAISDYEEDEEGTGTVTVFIDLQQGIDIEAIAAELLILNATTSSSSVDFIGAVLNGVMERLGFGAEFASLSSSSAVTSSSTNSAQEQTDTIWSRIAALAQRFVDGVLSLTGLSVGSEIEPSGVTLYDTQTGEPYCLVVTNGMPTSLPGVCTDITFTSDVSQDDTTHATSTDNDGDNSEDETATSTEDANSSEDETVTSSDPNGVDVDTAEPDFNPDPLLNQEPPLDEVADTPDLSEPPPAPNEGYDSEVVDENSVETEGGSPPE